MQDARASVSSFFWSLTATTIAKTMSTSMQATASVGEGLMAAERAAAALATCEDMAEALRIFREGEAGLRRAERRLEEVERELKDVASKHTEPDGRSYAACLRAAEDATRALSSCKDAEEALRLLRVADASLDQADVLLNQVEGAMRRVDAFSGEEEALLVTATGQGAVIADAPSPAR